MTAKTCIITGANSGIGKAAAQSMAASGWQVIMACRNSKRGQSAMADIQSSVPDANIELMIVDMSEQASIKVFAEEVTNKYPAIDVVIQNAAIFNITQKEPEYSKEGIETVWAANHLGPVLLNRLLTPALAAANGRIITISSKGLMAMPFLSVRLEDPEFKTTKYSVVKAYYQSKRAQEIYTLSEAERLSKHSIELICIRVTAVKVDVSRHPELSDFQKWVYSIKAKQSISPEEMAMTYTYAAESPELGGRGGCIIDEKHKIIKPNRYTSKPAVQSAVMKLTSDYLESGTTVEK